MGLGLTAKAVTLGGNTLVRVNVSGVIRRTPGLLLLSRVQKGGWV